MLVSIQNYAKNYAIHLLFIVYNLEVAWTDMDTGEIKFRRSLFGLDLSDFVMTDWQEVWLLDTVG